MFVSTLLVACIPARSQDNVNSQEQVKSHAAVGSKLYPTTPEVVLWSSHFCSPFMATEQARSRQLG